MTDNVPETETGRVKLLVADDEAAVCLGLQKLLEGWGYEVILAADGEKAFSVLLAEDPPRIAILDWIMPKMDGVEVCRTLRAQECAPRTYCILLSSKDETESIVAGIEAGADDYITKPFDKHELKVRVAAGERIVRLEQAYQEQVKKLEVALAEVNQLQGLLPICMYCKRIRDTDEYWHEVEEYISERSEAVFSHGICPECFEQHLGDWDSAAREGGRT